jgi:hypothetical protein
MTSPDRCRFGCNRKRLHARPLLGNVHDNGWGKISIMSSIAGHAGKKKTIVFILPKALGSVDPELLRTTLVDSPTPVRVLLCLPDSTGHALAATLAEIGVETEILLGPDVHTPETTAFALHAPPGTSADDQIEFALALSDVALVASAFEQDLFCKSVKLHGKPMVIPGTLLPSFPSLISPSGGLDPESLRGIGPHLFGRFHQTIIALLPLPFGEKRGGLKRLSRIWGLSWRPVSYFAPSGWQKLAPDLPTLEHSMILAGFDELDRSATYGTYIHGDFIWMQHLGTAIAVLLAVASYTMHFGPLWTVAELVVLLIVGFAVLKPRRSRIQDRWMTCRLSAELLRTARMSLPLLVLPPGLATRDIRSIGSHDHDRAIGSGALAYVKRVVREQGLPRIDPALTPPQAARWLRLIVADQIAYYDRDYYLLKQLEQNLRVIKQAIFLIAIMAVLTHFCLHAEWLLLFTAATPAFAAALHGAEIRLGILHRVPLSLEMKNELTHIDNALANTIRNPPPFEDAWLEVRRLAVEATTIFGRDTLWLHHVLRHYGEEF